MIQEMGVVEIRRARVARDVRSSLAWSAWFGTLSDIWWTRARGGNAIAEVRAMRIAKLMEHARAHSAFYRHAWRNLPLGPPALGELPVVTRRALMARFDEWVTDPAIKRQDIESFLKNRDNIGNRYRGQYIVWKSSGSTGEPGIYVQDEMALGTYDALVAMQATAVGMTGVFASGLIEGGRAVLIAATGDHFASIASWQRACRDLPWISARVLSVMDALPQLVAELNAYQPAFVASYPTLLAQLADEQAAGRLRIVPSCLWSGGECLSPSMAEKIKRAFSCKLINEYGASECMSIAFSCDRGRLHINADWVVLEPVDRHYRPTPAGERSHTVLLTNLANYVQPLIRYDLGDSIIVEPSQCECGSPLAAITVDGRADEVVSLRNAGGSIVSLLPLALTTVVEESANVHRFQLVQQAPDRLALRLEPAGRQLAWHAAHAALRHFLRCQTLGNVQVTLDSEPPKVEAHSGKLRAVIIEHCATPRVH